MTETTPLLELREVTKRFPGVTATRKASIAFFPGRVHALLGENGAGKSTIVKMISGIYQPDEGAIVVDGQRVRLHSPADAEAAGVAVVHQHRTLVDELTVAENLFLGHLGRAWARFRRRTWEAKARELLGRVRLDVSPGAFVGDVGPAAQQTIEIARAIGRDARLIIFDEPTTSLTPPEREVLFDLVRDLRDQGIAVVYISHDLGDALALSDEVTVLRDGAVVAHERSGWDVQTVVRHMIGRSLDSGFPRTRRIGAETVLDVRDLRSPHLRGVSVSVSPGEIVGVAGLVGSGRTELLRAVFGLDPVDGGQILLDGRPFRPRSPRHSIAAGIGFVTEDRKGQGLVLDLSVSDNVVLGNERPLASAGLIATRRQNTTVDATIRSLQVKTSSRGVPVGTLSGGNQQKVVLGRWLARSTRLLLIDEPTVGIDVGARGEFYKLLDDYAAAGGACLVVSSDLTEILGLADRVVVLRAGASVAEMKGSDMNREAVLRAMVAAA
ncbi:sugar ABC transporter ATP-binding protein [Jiangella asiatica]|uniref:Sugar ABC transporter ATP-binding protein n=1 Tax=Jiangella asiatica TaxID=2530372 RepID=A0A4R5CTN1_9ACTN|nr:sugar ABC transporter ATP-binding protein [Jiangella asiatica]TDE01165.1 sugar ABC transporter ATP-binding protein [Jiangella asiatica]